MRDNHSLFFLSFIYITLWTLGLGDTAPILQLAIIVDTEASRQHFRSAAHDLLLARVCAGIALHIRGVRSTLRPRIPLAAAVDTHGQDGQEEDHQCSTDHLNGAGDVFGQRFTWELVRIVCDPIVLMASLCHHYDREVPSPWGTTKTTNERDVNELEAFVNEENKRLLSVDCPYGLIY